MIYVEIIRGARRVTVIVGVLASIIVLEVQGRKKTPSRVNVHEPTVTTSAQVRPG